MSKVSVFLPMRKGSERIINKNVKDFAGVQGGLTFIKISQLLNSKMVDNIIVSTDDHEVRKIALSFNSDKIIIDDRPSGLAQSDTSTDELIKYVADLISGGVVLWTHVTSPFITEDLLDDMVTRYFSNTNKFDSLMTVTKIQTFLWNESKPVNYDDKIEKWPRTQTIDPLYEVNSGVFIADIEIYRKMGNRIGNKPFLYELTHIQAADVDWPDDFDFAEAVYKHSRL
ncbi:acylneuraminate cytidylyltransferase family protein [Amylibacter sp.]|nr:acylneuraminate cytidylyltransferase family protein [Amylibacter sp.]